MHLMIDLETLSTSPNAVVLSLGAVLFDENEIQRAEYIVFDAQEQIDALKRHVSLQTVAWWASQPPDAREVLSPTEVVSVRGGLSILDTIMPRSQWEDVKVWGNGAGFDLPIVHTLYEAVSRKAPWKFYNERCFRTAKESYKVPKPDRSKLREHHALDDAIHQAQHLQAIWKAAGASK